MAQLLRPFQNAARHVLSSSLQLNGRSLLFRSETTIELVRTKFCATQELSQIISTDNNKIRILNFTIPVLERNDSSVKFVACFASVIT
jgi:hypothetical protein